MTQFQGGCQVHGVHIPCGKLPAWFTSEGTDLYTRRLARGLNHESG